MPATTLIFAGVAALVNLWLAIRCGRVRTAEKINHGDGGSVLLQRRMRAHLNFAENTPIVLILVLLLEVSGTPPLWLAIVGDVLFQGSIGRTDFPMGNHADLINAITTRLWPLGGETIFVPGHGPTSNFAHERKTNAFVSDYALS